MITRAIKRSRQGVNLVRGLRFRLAGAFLLFFLLLLAGLGIVVRQLLVNIVTNQTYALLDEEWAASKGYLRIENQRPLWMADPVDPEEALIVSRIQVGGPYLIADTDGNILQANSPINQTLGLDTEKIKQLIAKAPQSPQPPAREVLIDNQGTSFLLHYGMFPDLRHRYYLLLIGRSLGDGMKTVNQFTWRYAAVVPLMLLLCAGLGWVVAGRALVPVTEVAQTAQRITGSNLSVQIPLRGSGDELDRLIQSFNRMIQRLNRSFEQTRQFSTDVSHELRTPLTAIRGQLEVALFTAETTEHFRDAMVNALQDVEHLTSIVKALLMLSQAESGQVVLQMTTLNFGDMVRDMVDQYQIPAEEAQIHLEIDCAEDVTIRGDKVQIGRLISNLLSNAIKYTPAGGSVRVGVGPRGDMVAFWVEDTGIGIPAEKLPHIFDRFYRVRRSESNPVQGLGLGLSFVSWIVQEHGGKIDVDSTEGKGTRFTITLPLQPRDVAPPPSVAADHARL